MNGTKIFSAVVLIAIVLAFTWMKYPHEKRIPGSSDDITVDTTHHIFRESFENVSKGAYQTGKLALESGPWLFNNSLIGSLAADVKNEAQSARLKKGYIETTFEIKHLKRISFSYALFDSNGKEAILQLSISTDGGRSFQNLSEQIHVSSGSLTTFSHDLPDYPSARFRIENLSASRVNIDDVNWIADENNSSLKDSVSATESQSSSQLSKRNSRVGKDAPPPEGENSNMYLGNISNASTTQPDNFLLDQGYYISSYNKTKAIPNWVSWHLDKSNISGKSGRRNNFAADIALPSEWYQVQSNSYSGSGFDRGHNCPSGDRTSSAMANSSTFLMTNMIPQAPENNQKIWSDFEVYIRNQIGKGNEAYIVMGVYGSGGYGAKAKRVNSIDGGKIAVPARIWKVAVILPEGADDLTRIPEFARIIAIDTPNENLVRPNWKSYITSIDDIEKATGFDILKNLPLNFQDEIEQTKYLIKP